MECYDADDVRVLTPDWAGDHPAVHREQPAGAAGSWLLRHPTLPFLASVPDDGGDIRARLFEVARRYVARVPDLAALPFDSDPPSRAQGFGWLPLSWGDAQIPAPADPRRSFWLVRRRVVDGARQDRTAVLLAGNRLFQDGALLSLGGSVGLRLVMHVGWPVQGRSLVRLTSASGGGFDRAVPLPAGPSGLQIDFEPFLQLTRSAGLSLGLDGATLDGLAPGSAAGDAALLLSGTGMRGPQEARRIYAWTLALPAGATIPQRRRLAEQVTHLDAPVLLADPASRGPGPTIEQRRPTRPAEPTLDVFRLPTALLPPAVGGRRVLGDARVLVPPAQVGNTLVPPEPPQPIDIAEDDLPLRSDELAAAHGFVRGQELFQRLDAYGLASDEYFRFARLPLIVQHRASFPYASNGETVNARVRPLDPGQNLFQSYATQPPPRLQVSFGCANLTHRELHGNDAGLPRAQPLGLAADRRWAWHEFGHVLNFAATGELEFRFAHSAGDALAAIVGDPDSDLAAPARLRGLTFPWVMMTRSHARPARLGWCWCGRRSALRRRHDDGPPPLPGGYFEEQLVSSSLYRFYQAIGGRPGNTLARRRSASDYAVYLIMRAIALLGPATVVPARSADQFVTALIDADIGTGDWAIDADWPEPEPTGPEHRIGGALHKVLRWAFERQGLYASDDPDEIVEGPGRPPAVDVYIPGSGPRSGGSYAPVALGWSTAAAEPWHAEADSLAVNVNGGVLLRVRVGNRGRSSAAGVSARAWVCPIETSPLAWQPLAAAGAPAVETIGAGSWRTFSFLAEDGTGNPLAGRWLVLAEASCPADRANTDPAAALPCGDPAGWADPALLTNLVANDNNLALRVVDFG